MLMLILKLGLRISNLFKLRTSFRSQTARIIFLICALQVLIVMALSYKIYRQITTLRISINPINNTDIIVNPDQNLRNFYEPKPNSEYTDSAPWVSNSGKITINTDGLNERFNYSINKDPGVFRIVTLGDSFTFGINVSTTDNYPEQLEDRLNSLGKCQISKRFEIINLGVGGYDIEYALHRFTIRGQKYDPDLILWFLKYDDFREIADFISNYSINTDKALMAAGKNSFYTKDGIVEDSIWQSAQKKLSEKIDRKSIEKYQTTKLYSIREIFNNKLLVFAFENSPNEYLNILKDFANNTELTYYTTIPALKKPDEEFPDSHPNAKGYSAVANNLFTYLTTNNLIPCN